MYLKLGKVRVYYLNMEKISIFGTGNYGMRALWEYGTDNIACFIDNNKDNQEKFIEGIPVVSFEKYQDLYKDTDIIIASTYLKEISNQLVNAGITRFKPYLPKLQYYYPENILVDNPYSSYRNEAMSEDEWNDKTGQDRMIGYINECVKLIKDDVPLFNHVEIETYNRCNGGCEFCPVSVKNETRPEQKMSEDLFKKIIDDLDGIDYSGKLALFSNNEPFLDERIIDFHRYARARLPKARMHLYTNGTLLTVEKFLEVIEYLDELIIDNYNENLELIPNNRAIKEYCENHKELYRKVTIVLRKPKEILTSRGGDAPNRKKLVSYENDSCMLPFRQIIIRPDGKVSLCCNDPLGKLTMGDLMSENIKDVWYGDKYTDARNKIALGRANYSHCVYCDSFIVG